MRSVVIAGARPNFVKVAPLLRALRDVHVDTVLVHTGQHYDWAMSESLFVDLAIPAPDVNLEVGSASHAVQTARVMIAFDEYLDANAIDQVVTVGDVNSTRRVRAGRRETRRAGRARRSGTAFVRPDDARRGEPHRRRLHLELPVHAVGRCGREPARRRRRPEPDPPRRQHHGRQPAGESPAGDAVGHSHRARDRGLPVRRRHAAPSRRSSTMPTSFVSSWAHSTRSRRRCSSCSRRILVPRRRWPISGSPRSRRT